MNPTTRMPSRSLPSASKKMMPGGPNRPKRLSSALCSSLLAVTSALSSSMRPMRSATRGVAEGEALHLLARHAPVGIEVEQHRAVGLRQAGISSAMEFTFSNCGTFAGAAAWARRIDSGCSGSREPASAPTRIAAPASSSTTPTPFQKRCQPLACGGSGSMACRKIAENSSSAAQPSIIASARDHRGDHPQRDRQQHHAEGLLDPFHPRPDLGQQAARGHAHRQQRRAHAQRPSRTAPSRRAPRRRSGRCRAARRPAAPPRTGRRSAPTAPPSRTTPPRLPPLLWLAVSASLLCSARRQLQLVEAEHRQRQQHEERARTPTAPTRSAARPTASCPTPRRQRPPARRSPPCPARRPATARRRACATPCGPGRR